MSSPSDPNVPDPLATTDEHELPIPAGEAQVVLSVALDDLVRAYKRVESLSMALARQADLKPG